MFEDLLASDVHDAAQRIAPHVKHTRLVRNDTLSGIAGGDVWLKLENEQITGSYKLRGALNALSLLPDARRKAGVVAASAGNHGMGISYAAKTLGVRVKVYVPRTAPDVKKAGIRALGAEIDDTEPHYDAALEAAMRFAKETKRPFINACVGDDLLAGQGTVALEILDELPAVKSVVIPVGGAGLLGGCASLLRRERPDVKIHGAQTDVTAAMAKSLAADRVAEVEIVPTLADGLSGQIDDYAFDIGKHALDGIVTISEDELARTIAWFARAMNMRVEGAGACAAGAVLHRKLHPETPCAIIVSGGNIDERRWKEIVGV